MSLPSWARVGAKVVCIDAVGTPELVEGQTYTIEAVDDVPLRVGGFGVWLVDVGVMQDRVGSYFGFRLSRFRPLVTIEDDIATHFASLLDVREPVGV
jgi:hypothetical protein